MRVVVMSVGFALLFFLALGLSMDAFAVSVTNGLCYRMPLWKNALASALAFGLFQALMPLAGYYAGNTFSYVIESVDHWIALLLLGVIGGRMVVEALKDGREAKHKQGHRPATKVFSYKTLAIQAVATSIDALAVGVGLGVIQVNIWLAVSLIGATTFLCSAAGVCIGRRFGRLFSDKAELLGGIILIGIGLRIFFEHTLG